MVFKNNLNLQEIIKTSKDFFNLVFVCEEISPRYGNDKNKVFFSPVVNWERLMNKLSTNVLKQLSIRVPVFLKNPCFKKLSSSWNFAQSEQILKQGYKQGYKPYQVCISSTRNFQNGCTHP